VVADLDVRDGFAMATSRNHGAGEDEVSGTGITSESGGRGSAGLPLPSPNAVRRAVQTDLGTLCHDCDLSFVDALVTAVCLVLAL